MKRYDGPAERPVLLALRALKLGDLLVAVPAVAALRRAFPGHELVLAVPGWLEPIVDLVPGVDALLPTPGLDDPLPVPSGEVDVAVNLHGSGPESRSLVDRLDARLSIVHRVEGIDAAGPGIPPDPEAPPPVWRPELHERSRWIRLLSSYGIDGDPDEVGLLPSPVSRPVPSGCAVVHVGAFHGSRLWPAERFAAVAAVLAARGERVVFTGGSADRDRALEVARLGGFADAAVVAGELRLGEFAAVVERARLVVSADTGAAHIASAYATPSVVLFGPAAPENWGPPPGPHVVLTDARVRRGDAFADEPDPAILAVGVDDVLAAADRLLQP